jgi:hypothetical protein
MLHPDFQYVEQDVDVETPTDGTKSMSVVRLRTEHVTPETGYVYHVETRNVEREDVAAALLESQMASPTYRVTLDDEQEFKVTALDSMYEPVEEYDEGSGYFERTVEFDSVPDVDLKPDRYPTDVGEIAVVETDEGWGTPTLHAAVQHVEEDELVRWEYPPLGTIATIQEVNGGE